MAAPAPVARPSIAARMGFDGQEQSQGHWNLEYHPDLKLWENRVDRFNENRTGDGSIVAALEKLWYPTARATWTIDAGAEDSRATDAAELLTANILRRGEPGHDVYRMITPWRQFLWECFTAEQFGVSVHEIVHRMQPGPLGTLKVVHHAAWIHPSTIWQFRVDRDGAFLGIVQQFVARWWEGDTEKSDTFDDFIPAENLFLHVRKQEGSNVEGTALLRGMYADAKRNQNFRNWQAIHAQRVAVGIPKVKIASEAPPEVQERAIQMAKLMRGGAQDRAYVVESPGVEVGWVDNGSNALDMSPLLRQGEDRLRGVASLEWAGLGLGGAGGSRAVGDVQQRPFWLQCEGIADSIAEDIQTGIVEPLHRSNYGTAVAPPRLRAADVAPINVVEIATAAQAGLIVVRAKDENDLRRALRMRPLSKDEIDEHDKLHAEAREAKQRPAERPYQPERTAPEDKPAEDAPAEPKDAPKDAEPDEDIEESAAPVAVVELAAKSKHSEKPRYQPKHVKYDTVRAAFRRVTQDVAQALKPARIEAVKQALAGVTIKGVRATMGEVDREPLETILREQAEKARETGREMAREEIRAAVAALDVKAPQSLTERALIAVHLAEPKPFDPFAAPAKGGLLGFSQLVSDIDDEMEVIVQINLDRILDDVAKGLRRELMQQLAGGMDEDEALEEAQRALLDRSDASLDDIGREMASRGINNGRAEVASQAAEAMDGAGVKLEMATRVHVGSDEPCDGCSELDGAKYEVGGDDYFANMPPAKCDGAWRCHCVFEFDAEKVDE